ncbi:MAG: hypothetical protein ACTSRP_22780, partial [Candidatus Helarchaeota archaeon]
SNYLNMKFIEFMRQNLKYWLILLTIGLLICIFYLPLEYLEYLSIEIVGGPPINGKTWMEGVYALGGPISMRVLASIGLIIIILNVPIIIILNVPIILKWEKAPVKKLKVSKLKVFLFLIIAAILFVVNIVIGYDWWDPEAILGMGPLFFPSIITIILIGFIPEIIKRVIKNDLILLIIYLKTPVILSLFHLDMDLSH